MIEYKRVDEQLLRLRYLIFCAIAGFFAFSTSISFIINDSYLLFHEGEYVGILWHLRSFYAGAVKFPVLIHGAMDYVPSMMASLVYGDDRVIVGTRGINTLITFACWVLFLDLCYLFTSKHSQRWLWISVAIGALFLLTPKLGSHALAIQQSFLGVRDLFLLLTVWGVAKHAYSAKPFLKFAFLAMAAVSAAVAFFWSYDRGVISIFFLGIYCLGLVVNRDYRGAVFTVIAAALAAIVLDHFRLLGSAYDNLRNVMYWLHNAKEVSGTDMLANRLTFVTILLLLSFCLGTATITFIKRFRPDRQSVFLILAVAALQMLLLKTVMTRPGMPRLSWAIWPSVLMLIYLASRSQLPNIRISFEAAGEPARVVRRVLQAAAAIFLMLAFFMSPLMLSYGSFAKNILNPKSNAQVVTGEINELARTLSGFNDGCFFGWTNEGVVALLMKRRFCTRFPYAVYVAKNEEADYLEQLKAEAPKAIVMGVGGVTMLDIGSGQTASRLPAVSSHIQKYYPHKLQVGRYTVVSTAAAVGSN